jgi:hypothetical protein
MNQFVTAETKKTAAIIVKLLENLLDCGHIIWIDVSHSSPEFSQFVKSNKVLCWNFAY